MPTPFITLENLYLLVPREEKDEAKKRGARWDPEIYLWYIPPGLDPLDFRRWWSFLRPAFADKEKIKSMGGKFHLGRRAWYVPNKLDYDEFKTWWPKDCRQYIFNDRFAAYSKPAAGGQSVVFWGYDLTNDKECAIKLFDAADDASGEATEAFERELDALLKLEHPNILPILDWGRHEPTGQHFIVSPWVRWTLRDIFDDKESVVRSLYVVLCENYEIEQDEDEFVSSVLNDDEGEDPWLELCDTEELGKVLKGLNYAADNSIIHRDIKPENIFFDLLFHPDVVPDLDDEPNFEMRRKALIEAGKENGYVTYEDISYVQGDQDDTDDTIDLVSDLMTENIDIRDNITETTLIADFGASKNWLLEGKKNKTMVLLRTEPWTPPRTDTELFFERTWDGYAWGVLAIALMCEELPETREDIDRLLDGRFKEMVGENLWEFISRVVHVEADRRPTDIVTLTEELEKLNDQRREAIGA